MLNEVKTVYSNSLGLVIFYGLRRKSRARKSTVLRELSFCIGQWSNRPNSLSDMEQALHFGKRIRKYAICHLKQGNDLF